MKSARSLGLLVLVCSLGACGSDEPTRPQLSPEALASQFDSLGVAIGQSGDSTRSLAFLLAARAVRAGSEPADVIISEDGVAATYQAVAAWFGPDTFTAVNAHIGPSLRIIPSHWYLVVWNGEPATGRLFSLLSFADSVSLDIRHPADPEGDSVIFTLPRIGIGMLIEDGALRLLTVSGTAVLTLGEPAAPCEEFPALQRLAGGPLVSRADAVTPIECTRAAFGVRLDAELEAPTDSLPFYPDPGAPSHRFTMQRQTVNGIRLAHVR